jgi:ketosteroid isomerase-like protein
MAHAREEVEATVKRYVELREAIDSGQLDSFAVLADMYTDDAVYVDASWGRLEGQPAIADWLEYSMVGLMDWRFPIEFTAIEGDHVIVKWTQIIPGQREDGSPYTQSAYSHLIYAGDGKFSYEEDCYNMTHVLEDVSASGWSPEVEMNIPPAHPDRNWSPEPTGKVGH